MQKRMAQAFAHELKHNMVTSTVKASSVAAALELSASDLAFARAAAMSLICPAVLMGASNLNSVFAEVVKWCSQRIAKQQTGTGVRSLHTDPPTLA